MLRQRSERELSYRAVRVAVVVNKDKGPDSELYLSRGVAWELDGRFGTKVALLYLLCLLNSGLVSGLRASLKSLRLQKSSQGLLHKEL